MSKEADLIRDKVSEMVENLPDDINAPEYEKGVNYIARLEELALKEESLKLETEIKEQQLKEEKKSRIANIAMKGLQLVAGAGMICLGWYVNSFVDTSDRSGQNLLRNFTDSFRLK